jgi:hypothetical protein
LLSQGRHQLQTGSNNLATSLRQRLLIAIGGALSFWGHALILSLRTHVRRTALFAGSEQKNSVRLPPTGFRLQDRTGCDFAVRGE